MRILALCLLVLFGCSQKNNTRESIDLSGKWQFALDPENLGLSQHWENQKLDDSITLPGITDAAHKGKINPDTSTMHLYRPYAYEGAAWYSKTILVPNSFADQHLELILERTKCTNIWIDGQHVGTSKILQSPQHFDVTEQLTPGEHQLTIQVNNNRKLTPYGNVHIYSDDTHTNWNGILGKMIIEASNPTAISKIKVTSSIDQNSFTSIFHIRNPENHQAFDLNISIYELKDGNEKLLETTQISAPAKSSIPFNYSFKGPALLWNEYEQPLYRLEATLTDDSEVLDQQSTFFGMSQFSTEGSQFTINHRKTFLRGKHDAAVFPIRGYIPTDVESWRELYKKAKAYGINHYRFHSYCPPEAAFTAADLEGIYLQAELPFWGGMDTDSIAEMQLAEGLALLDAYGNHPSFVLFSPGNELWSGHDRVEKYMTELKKYDSRHLYTMGSNNNIGYLPPRDYADFFVGARSTSNHDARLTHAFPDAKDGGLLNTTLPATNITFDQAVAEIKIPLISHEIGQYQIYPNYDEIKKYTGVLKAENLNIFQKRLNDQGLGDMDSAFQRASGAWSALCYKAEMEAALRTEGMAGFQLLDLQDYSGQGTALVGILDAFMDSKNVISEEDWKASCNDVTLLLEFEKYCWKSSDHFSAKIKIANYSASNLNDQLFWQAKNESGATIASGNINLKEAKAGSLTDQGNIQFDFPVLASAEKLNISVMLQKNHYHNEYPIWVYPFGKKERTEDLIIAKSLTDSNLSALISGTNMLLMPSGTDISENSIDNLFPPDFWNFGMFKSISEWNKKPISPGTLGLLMEPSHPIFEQFPTNFHTNWQWYRIIKASRSLNLSATPADYRPIVQIIDNLERNLKLGMIMEFKIGKGKILICTAALEEQLEHPEVAAFYNSIIHYMKSDQFDPSTELSEAALKELIR